MEIDERQLASVISEVVRQEFIPQVRQEVQQMLLEERRRIVGGLPAYVQDRVREELFKAFGYMQDKMVDDVVADEEKMLQMQKEVEDRAKESQEVVKRSQTGDNVVRRRKR